MPLFKEDKLQIFNDFRINDKDVGSPEVQIGLLSKRIENVALHIEKAPKDNHSRRGLISMVAKRRKLLNYIKKKRPEKYPELLNKVGLRK